MWTTCPRLLRSLVLSRIWTCDLLIASPTLFSLRHCSSSVSNGCQILWIVDVDSVVDESQYCDADSGRIRPNHPGRLWLDDFGRDKNWTWSELGGRPEEQQSCFSVAAVTGELWCLFCRESFGGWWSWCLELFQCIDTVDSVTGRTSDLLNKTHYLFAFSVLPVFLCCSTWQSFIHSLAYSKVHSHADDFVPVGSVRCFVPCIHILVL